MQDENNRGMDSFANGEIGRNGRTDEIDVMLLFELGQEGGDAVDSLSTYVCVWIESDVDILQKRGEHRLASGASL